ncbi:hypothetical protein SANTM175S_00966 [Streptomyces antimycoticus]
MELRVLDHRGDPRAFLRVEAAEGKREAAGRGEAEVGGCCRDDTQGPAVLGEEVPQGLEPLGFLLGPLGPAGLRARVRARATSGKRPPITEYQASHPAFSPLAASASPLTPIVTVAGRRCRRCSMRARAAAGAGRRGRGPPRARAAAGAGRRGRGPPRRRRAPRGS